MAFIDIFNFKKYFAKPSDSQVARYGHVNALYTNLKITVGSYDFDITEGDLTVTTKAGVITFLGDIDMGGASFNLASTEILPSSVILLTIGSSNDAALVATTRSAGTGDVHIVLHNDDSIDAEDVVLNYLIIN
jgi:hypothetical protein